MIAVIGDIMLDKYIYGSSIRNSPEFISAPVIKPYSIEEYLGGAGNTALNIENLGQSVGLFCALHKNSTLFNLLNTQNIDYTHVPNYSSDILKTRVINNGEYVARIDYDHLVDCSEDALVDCLFSSEPDLIVLSDYNKGTISKCKQLIERANYAGIRTLVDPKKCLTEYEGAFILKPNLKEFAEWLSFDSSLSEEELLNKLSKNVLIEAYKDLKVDNLIITLGSQGCILVNNALQIKKIDALSVKAKDVTGAGDSFIAALAVSLYEQNNVTKAVDFAIKVAGIAVTKKGTSYVKRNEI